MPDTKSEANNREKSRKGLSQMKDNEQATDPVHSSTSEKPIESAGGQHSEDHDNTSKEQSDEKPGAKAKEVPKVKLQTDVKVEEGPASTEGTTKETKHGSRSIAKFTKRSVSASNRWVLRQSLTLRQFVSCRHPAEPDEEEVADSSAENLSYVGKAAYEVLRNKHSWQHHALWNITSGKVVGEVHQTPTNGWDVTQDPPEGHSDWFPQKLASIVSRTEYWCDVLSLTPPLGTFMEEMQKALATVGERSKSRPHDNPVIVRMMFGNIVASPVNCNKVIKKLTKKVPDDANLYVWVGAWRRRLTWNHAKIIAVDGKYLHTGGHNMWDYDYLRNDPVYDLGLEMEGNIAHDAHLFANAQWAYLEKKQRTPTGYMVDRMPDGMPMLLKTRVTVSEFPRKTAKLFPPRYKRRFVPKQTFSPDRVPMIGMGRYGNLVFRKRASDDAIVEMILSAKKIIHFAIQDLGPMCIPKTKRPVPGYKWPKKYMNAIARVIWRKAVDVEIVLSNPHSVPGGQKPIEANYGNGWSCVDVAAEIIKRIKKQFPKVDDADLRDTMVKRLRVSFIRNKQGNKWSDGKNIGLHSKHFIIDDVCTYIGSQNLYMCDLAEWGVVIDDPAQTKKIMNEFWIPMWKSSYRPEDCDVKEVMDSLDIDREGPNPMFSAYSTRKEMRKVEQTNMGVLKDEDNDNYNVEDEIPFLPNISLVKSRRTVRRKSATLVQPLSP